MTREQVLKLFPDATDEQVTNLLNQSNAELAKEKNKTAQYKEKADKADELADKLSELETKGMSETEKATKALETANARIAELETAQALAAYRNDFATKIEVTAEQATQVVKDDGSYNLDALGQVVSEKVRAAVKDEVAKIAAGSVNPGGSNGGGGEKTEAEKLAETIGDRISGVNQKYDAVMKNYL